MHQPVKPLPSEDLNHVLQHTNELWKEAYGKSFFITGGTGFFGMWLLESFTHINQQLGLNMRGTVLTRDPLVFASKAPHLAIRDDLTFIQGDIRSFKFPKGCFDYIIHSATETSAKVNHDAAKELLDTIISGTRRILDFAEQCSVKKLLLTSSGAVYGRQPSELTHISEDYGGAPDPLLQSSAYGEGKRISEHLCSAHALQYGYKAKIARCFAFVGPHLPLDAHFAIGNFIRDVLNGSPIQITGDGRSVRSYLYMSDLAVWLWTILFKGISNRAYNVGSENSLSIQEIAQLVQLVSGISNESRVPQEYPPGGGIQRYVPSTHRARRDLKLDVIIQLDDAIRRTIEWHKTIIK